MNCQQAREFAIDHARSGAPLLDSHFRDCRECGEFLQSQLSLRFALAGLAKDVPASPDLLPELLAEFVASHAAKPAPRWSHWRLAALAAAAASLAAIALTIHPNRPAPQLATRPFLEIPYVGPLAPYERTHIVRMKVPVSALIAAGFDVHVADTGSALNADVLFGQDGRAHAIRPISGIVLISTGE